MANQNGQGQIEEYTIAELVDDALESGQWNDYMLNRYVYAFKQGQRVIRGLTAEAIAHLALRFGISIESTTKEILKEGVLYSAVAIRTDEDGRVFRAEGVAYQPFKIGSKMDQFCWQKALTKASRNARRQLIPATIQIQAIDELTKLEAPKLIADAQVVTDPPPPAEDKYLVNARKRCFAVFREEEDVLGEMGITSEMFWNAVRVRFSVKSRAELGLDDWKGLADDLKGGADWIKELAPPPEVDNNADEPAVDEQTGMPF